MAELVKVAAKRECAALELVIAGHSASEDARERAYAPQSMHL